MSSIPATIEYGKMNNLYICQDKRKIFYNPVDDSKIEIPNNNLNSSIYGILISGGLDSATALFELIQSKKHNKIIAFHITDTNIASFKEIKATRLLIQNFNQHFIKDQSKKIELIEIPYPTEYKKYFYNNKNRDLFTFKR